MMRTGLQCCAILLLCLPNAAAQETESHETDAIRESPITDYDREHWAFQSIARPAPPATKSAVASPIDAFLLSRLEEEGLSFAPTSDRRTLLRRLSFDLTGLPPTQEELAAFLADASPLAYEKQVDRLLASPHFGERAAQFWLDLARFAETDGFEHDKLRPDAWRYRDWLIEAFNRDRPYDEFAKAQLAGDATGLDSDLTATMFCLAGPDMPDINDQHLRRHDRLNELTSTVGSVFLGLQFGCAQCHDHKYDPLSQADFYRLRAIFEPSVPPLRRDAPYYVFAAPPASAERPVTRFWIRGEHGRPGPELVAAYPRIADLAPRNDASPPTPADFADWLARPENPLFARVAANRLWQQHFGKGLFATPSDAGLVGASPSHEDLLNWLAVELREGDWSMKSLRRKIVTSQAYRQASRRDAESNLESTAQITAAWRRRLEIDPENRLYSRYPRRRLEGEAIRDAMLLASGQLHFEQGGPGVMPPLPQELVSTLLKGQWRESKKPADHVRRSIYLFTRRNLRYPLFEAFDRPDANESCPVRGRSTTAPQALTLLNSDFVVRTSQAAARASLQEAAQGGAADSNPIDLLSRRILSRPPTSDERNRFETFWVSQSNLIRDAHADWQASQISEAALSDLALALFNSSEFLYIE